MQRTLAYAKGHQEFKNLFFKENEETFIRLVEKGQSPKTLFIGCSDSRVIPELISSFGPGELFVIRTAGNFVPYEDPSILWDGVAATIQYAVEVLGVSDVIVCGHSHCGAIEGLFKEIKMKTLANWLRFGHEAKLTTLEALGSQAEDATKYGVAERVSVLYQLDHLMTYPYVKEKVNQNKLNLHGWHFTIETGTIEYYDPENSKFLPLKSVLEKAKT
ncbi:MAG: carbonic anhydrase [Parachlamydiaceae bacterium]|nr:MAG: carbonic anhydrase [Parachlamydiaceae bacterium]